MSRSCWTCDHGMTFEGPSGKVEDRRVECRRYPLPPAETREHSNGSYSIFQAEWRMMERDHWCGEYREAPAGLDPR